MFTPKKLAILATAVFAISAQAQSTAYPNKPIKLIVPFSAGGVVDSVGRIIGERLAQKYGQPVVVENKAGAGGAIGSSFVAKSEADGYTLLTVSSYLTILPGIVKNPGWAPTKDFKPIAHVGFIPNVFVVNPANPANTFQQFMASMKSSANPLSYASPGVGTSNHLSGELLSQASGVKMVHIPYKGQSDALSDLLSGRVDMMPLTSALAGEYVKAGKLKALAVTTNVRSGALPTVPTVEEASDLKPFDVRSWFGFVAPAQTPDAIVAKLAADIRTIMDEKETMEKFTKLGLQKEILSAAQFKTYIQEDELRWKGVTRKAGIDAQ